MCAYITTGRVIIIIINYIFESCTAAASEAHDAYGMLSADRHRRYRDSVIIHNMHVHI